MASIKPTHLANTALALSAFVTLNNTYTLINPAVGLSNLGFKASTDRSLAEGLVQMLSATRMVVGLGSAAMWYYGSYRALGWATMAGVLMAGVDGWVCEKLGGTGKWVHWGSAPLGLLFGGGLLALVGV